MKAIFLKDFFWLRVSIGIGLTPSKHLQPLCLGRMYYSILPGNSEGNISRPGDQIEHVEVFHAER